MKVAENLYEFLNEGNEELFYVALTNPEEQEFYKEYAVKNKGGEVVWEGSEEDALTFLLRNAGINSAAESRAILIKADKFGGKSVETGDAIERKGNWGNLSKEVEGTSTTIYGVPIMMQPFMANKEIDKGRNENRGSVDDEGKIIFPGRKTQAQVNKKFQRELSPEEEEEEINEPEQIEPEVIEPLVKEKPEFPLPARQYHGRSQERRKEIENVKKRRPRI